jgi:lambda family phage portal protein
VTQAQQPIARPFYEPAIARHLPGWYARREQSRVEARRLSILATFSGGVGTRVSEEYASSTSYIHGSDGDRRTLFSMRDRARKAYRQNPVARTLIDTECDDVVSDGMTLQAKTGDVEFDKMVEERFAAWLDRADLRDARSGAGIQRAVWITRRVDGDVGVVLVSSGTGGESKLQLIPGDLIQSPDGRYGERNMVDGVEVDDAARPVAFHVLEADQRGTRKFHRIAARDFIYLPNLNDSDPLQLRGETAFSTVFEHMNNLEQYVDGVALAAWMATVFGIVFKERTGPQQHAALGVATNAWNAVQKSLRLENGSVKWQGTEDQMVQVDAKQPMQQTPEFIRTMLRLIGMPFQMPLEKIAKDMSTVNFASARIGLLGYYRACREKQCWYRGRFLSRVYQWWLSREVKTGRIELPAAIAETYWRHAFVPRGWEYTDPVSEAQGDLLEVTMGTKTLDMVAAERGRDMVEMDAANAATRARRKGLELPEVRSTFTRDAVPAPTPATPDDDTEEDDDDEESDEE